MKNDIEQLIKAYLESKGYFVRQCNIDNELIERDVVDAINVRLDIRIMKK